tara:strand:- start:4820 stop:7006 length:2187 start_codon:yes stop_codon:yes gene_type:complete
MANLLKRIQIGEQEYGVGLEENPFKGVSPDYAMKVCFKGGGAPPPPPPATVTQQTSNIPSYFKPYLERLFDRAEQVTTEPFQRYEGPRLAAPSAQQEAAYQGVEELVGGYKPYIGAADLLTQQASVQSTDPTAIASRMSPYQQSVIDIQKREALRDAEKLQQQIGASAVGAGAFGGSRQALQETELARQTGQRLADIQAVGSQQAYQQAMNQLASDRAAALAAGQQFAGLGAQQQQLGLAGLGALETVGGTQQAQQQRAFDIAYEDFARETTQPSQQVQEMSSILRGFNLPVSTYATTQTQQAAPTFGQQAAGLGLGALGIYGAGKGVGLFAEGGDVPDNPGIKKLAAKAPQVVEKMGFDPQEVMNAYVGGRMNYDNGGSIYGIESLLGSPIMTMDPRKQAEIMEREGDERLERRRKEAPFEIPSFFSDANPIHRMMNMREALENKDEIIASNEKKRKQGAKKDRKEDEIIITQTGNTNVNPNLIDSNNLTTTFTGLETDNILPQTDMGVSQSPYSALMNEQLASLFEKDKEGINIAEVANYLGMIQGIGGSREDIKAAQQSAIEAGKAKAQFEKDKKSDMFKALTLGMSAEQFEKQFGISKDKAEADIGLAESKTRFYDAMAGGSKLNDALMKQLKKDPTYNDYLNNIQFNEQELRKAEEAKDADRVKELTKRIKDTQIALNNYIKRYTSTFIPTSDVAKLGEKSMDNPFENIRDNMLIQEIKSEIN